MRVAVFVFAGWAVSAGFASAQQTPQSPASLEQANGLKIRDIKVGTGRKAERGAEVVVQYSGWLTNGTLFDSSRKAGQPFRFRLGGGEVIRGWDQGLDGMREGGVRELVIPPALAYGARGAPPMIPPNATLRFEIEMISTTPFPYTNVDNATLRDLLKKGVLAIDVRPLEEAAKGTVSGALKIPAFNASGRFQPSFFQALGRDVPKDKPIALLSADGNPSAAVAGFLSTQGGYAKVYNLYDGIDGWLKEGYPIER